MEKQWKLANPDEKSVARLSRALGCEPATATVLLNRGIASPQAARHFLTPAITQLRPPFAMQDMDRAVARILKALEKREKVLIFGDYDADGVTATVLLLEFFRQIGLEVSYYIPHRIEEGYDLQTPQITDYVLPRGFDLVITVDCGSSSREAVALAQQNGVDVIITDHHSVSDPPAPAFALINPKRKDCPADMDHLAGVGVAFSLIICLRKALREQGFWEEGKEPRLRDFCDLVALGTVADMVPLLAENRILSRAGLHMLERSPRPGLRALARSAKVSLPADTDDIAFRLAPRINAAGRMDHARQAVELLTTRDPAQAKQIAAALNQMNQDRQAAERRIFSQITAYLEKQPRILEGNSLVLAYPGWHEGILGIVASRLTEQYVRPVILISVKNGLGIGSGRSVPGFDLYQGLSACAPCLRRFGGHAMAAGLQIEKDRIHRFRQSFEQQVTRMGADSALVHTLAIDQEIGLDAVTDKLLDELELLQPFGTDNPEPLFMARDLEVAHAKVVGQQHCRMTLRQAGDRTARPISAIRFNIREGAEKTKYFSKLAFRLRWNRWQGRKTPQMIIEAG